MKILSVNKIPNRAFYNTKMKNNESVKTEDSKTDKALKILVPTALVLATIIGVKCFSNKAPALELQSEIKETVPYIETLSKSLSKWLKKDVETKSLESIMSGSELINELKVLKKENFVASKENIEKGIFCADLHSHSLYSDGKASVDDILNQVAEYGDKLNQKSGKKFIFSLTDHDSCEGIKEALKIISENPNKFKNVKFVTGAELSFLMKSDKSANPYETAEVLVYGFNPFEESVNNYFEILYTKRKNMVLEFIKDLNRLIDFGDFSIEEFNKNFGKNYMMNYQWQVHHYGQTKTATSGIAISKNIDKSKYYEEIISKISNKDKKNLYELRQQGLIPADFGDDTRITELCLNKFSPRDINNKTNYCAEANIDDIIRVFGRDSEIFGAFAHPYYMTERSSQVEPFIEDIVKRSNGFIKATESYHQAYNSNVDMNKVENLNKALVARNKLLELGGRDNHEKDIF